MQNKKASATFASEFQNTANSLQMLLFLAGSPSQAHIRSPAPPKWEPLAVHANFISLPRPLPLGELDLRNKDGEGEQAKVKVSVNKC